MDINTVIAGIRGVGALLAGGAGALISFGLLLQLAWFFSENATYKLITLLLVTALAFVIGGLTSGLLVRHNKILYGLILGSVLGLISFGYILGPNWRLLIAVPLSTFLSTLGSWLAAGR
jgi:hypothetical protein